MQRLLTLFVIHLVAYAGVYAALPGHTAWWGIAIASLLIWVSVVDVQTFEIPNAASALLVILALLYVWQSDRSLPLHLATGILSGVVFYVMGEQYFRLRGMDGLGMGDAKLMVGLGVLSGPTGAIWLVLIGSIAALLTILITRGIGPAKDGSMMTEGIAFGPFLCLSGWGVWLYQGLWI